MPDAWLVKMALENLGETCKWYDARVGRYSPTTPVSADSDDCQCAVRRRTQ